MTKKVDSGTFLSMARQLPVIDVRSPGEFMQGHIHGAFNIPIFDNEERASIGTMYVQTGKDPAIKLGMEIVGNKFSHLIEEAERDAPGKEMLLHCWRGGMRSESLAWFFEKLGYCVTLLEGGYKSYRRFIRKEFEKPMKLFILGGMTGTGKTEILIHLAETGQQVIDLEALANHKGSAFGHLGQAEQPTTEQFENDLFNSWDRMDPGKIVWLEHESNKVGKVFLPEPFFNSMQQAPLIIVRLPVEIRIRRLISEYACYDKTMLEVSLLNIREHLGSLQTKLCLDALEKDDFETVAAHTLAYYDKTYGNSLRKRPPGTVYKLDFNTDDAVDNSTHLLDFLKTQKIYEH